jgi:hypothetical protein
VIDVAAVKSRFEAVAPFLDERGRRLVAASEALAAGRGGVKAVPRGESAAVDEPYTVQRQVRSGTPTVTGMPSPRSSTSPRPSRMLRHPMMHVIGRKPVHFLDVNFEVLDRPVADVFELERIAWGVPGRYGPLGSMEWQAEREKAG